LYDRACGCGALVHARAIADLRTRARIGQMARDFDMAIGAYQRALQLVPEDHPEHAALSRDLDTLLGIAAPKAEGGGPSRSRLELVALLGITLCLVLLLLWPLLSGSHGAAGDDGRGQHPGRGLLQPGP
jgi:hypothetical protein